MLVKDFLQQVNIWCSYDKNLRASLDHSVVTATRDYKSAVYYYFNARIHAHLRAEALLYSRPNFF